MIRQTKTTIKELTSQYRAVLRHAFFAGIVGAIVMSTGNAGAAINVTTGTTDITNDVISAVIDNANTTYYDGSYTPKTWDSTNHDYVDGASTDAASIAPGAAPNASDVSLNLTSGATDLAAYNGGSYVIADPTTGAPGITVDATTYSYTNTAADGSTSVINLTAGDVSDTPVLATTGYDYAVTSTYRVNGDSSVNIGAGAPQYSDYQFSDGVNTYNLADYVNTDGDLVLPSALLNNVTAVTNAGDALAAYGNDKTAYNTVESNYNTSNAAYGVAVGNVNSDQATVDNAIETYRNQVGEWNAKDLTYTAYTTADANADAYNNSLANVIHTQASDAANAVVATAEQNAKDYADSLASNYDAAGAADAAETNAKGYADSLASNYDAAGAADAAETNAKGYADSLASNYDAAGAADAAETNAKNHANALDTAVRADFATADTATLNEAKGYADAQDALTLQSANAYTDSAIANASTLMLKSANDYTDKRVDHLEKEMSAGIANATALSAVAIPNVKKGQLAFSGGYGYYNSQSAVAFGATMGLTDKWSVNLGTGISDKSTSFRAGTTYILDLF